MHRAVAAASIVVCLATPALAVNVIPCGDDSAAHVAAIMEPWEKNAKLFYNGEVRVALTDTGGEPACCSQHLLILAPDPQSEDGGRACFVVNDHGDLGFAGIDFAKLAARYDAGKGLLITFPYTLYNEGNPGKGGIARVRVNVAKATAAAE
jgi:hypothetical protein